MPDLRAIVADAQRELNSVASTPLARQAVPHALAAFQPAMARVAERGEYGPGGQVTVGYYLISGGQGALIRRGTTVTCLANQTAVCLFLTLQPSPDDSSVVRVTASLLRLQPKSTILFHSPGPRGATVHGTRARLETGRLRGRLDELSGGRSAGGDGASIGISHTMK